ncbi:MAG: cytochrome-c peroxidase [Kangiellaceae bacterium]|jgi:cytochrome c peroxidase|nr:cytochrome-c peroxidase [Kangiellaceae bacterium]
MKLITTLTLLISISANAAQWQALPAKAPEPKDNPTTLEKVELGKMLYMDPRFSSTGTVSCNTCHNVMEGGDDSRAVSMGVHGKTGGRNAPTVWNSAFNTVQFWDGRAPLLEDQAKGPVTNPVEMGMNDLEQAMNRVRAIDGYKILFERAFGKDSMTVDNAAKAVAAFERTLITPNSAYDRYVKGDNQALSGQQIRGMKLFAEKGCVACHSGAAFNGPKTQLGDGFFTKFPTIGNTSYDKKYRFTDDKGREEVTGKASDRHLFRVPTLRNIADTAPYFHNGAVNSLTEAVQIMAKTQLNMDLSKQDTDDIVSFLTALSGEYPTIVMPRLPSTIGHSILTDKK